MDLHDYAVREMDNAWPESDPMQDSIKQNILDIVDIFCEQGHSGMSATYTLNILDRLLMWKPIAPLTGAEDEWGEPYGYGIGTEVCQQNKRCSSVFRHNFDNATAYDIDGKVFSDDGGKTFYSNIDSRIPVTFPYIPRTNPEKIIKAVLEYPDEEGEQ